jgi:hypothetical protein
MFSTQYFIFEMWDGMWESFVVSVAECIGSDIDKWCLDLFHLSF